MGERENGHDARVVAVTVTQEDAELAALEAAGILPPEGDASGHPFTDEPTQATLHLFGNPAQFRTMAKLTWEQIRLAAMVDAKGELLGSRVRRAYVKNLFLMSRSSGGWGSGQMADIARHTPAVARPKRRLFGFGRREE